MTLLQLKDFVKVANHGSFSLASKTLYVTFEDPAIGELNYRFTTYEATAE
ncbi:MAG: LysR family transcriptional regulator [Tenericutes bacterium]|jgi:hypothetical protein|nr:LysR family transcriptional regulator [Mycoplasmatota bacterium]